RSWAPGRSSNPLTSRPWRRTGTLELGDAEHQGHLRGPQLSLHLRPANSSPSEFWDHKPIASYSEIFAASVGNVDWLRFCLNTECKDIAVDDKGFTAIHLAAQKGNLSCIQLLIEECKFPVDLGNKSEVLSCIDYLLKKGAVINSQTCNGSTPLHLATCDGLLGCMKVLVQSGANVHTRDAMGYKPIDYCKIWNHHTCARFLKDAMWKQDKKDFAREMGKLQSLKKSWGRPAIALCPPLLQKEQRNLREADFRKWLQGKLLSQCHTLASRLGTGPWFLALSNTVGSRISRSFHPSVEAQLKSLPQPVVPPKPIHKQPTISWPKLWNLSNNPTSSLTTKIGCPQGIRLGMHPDPHQEHDFQRFLDMTQNSFGGTCLHTVNGHWVTPVPQVPFEVMIRVPYPGMQSYRMKVPQGLYPLSILNMPQKQHLGDSWTHTMAMSLRETFGKPFLAVVEVSRAGVLKALPSK
uniref:Ankyrin repeat domain 53 n=1 Tax=Nannospalax galili TaxID=1026970 RepID=A0A8C6RIB0_NANGA